MSDIERLCKVEVSEVKSHAIQLSGSQFRILATKPTQLTYNCEENQNKVKTIEGVFILELNDTCPKANTPDHLFVRNSQILASQQLIALPLVHEASRWINTLTNDFKNVRIPSLLDELKNDVNAPVSMKTFRNFLENRDWNVAMEYVDFLQLGLTAIALLLITYFSVCQIRRIIDCCLERIDNPRQRQPYGNAQRNRNRPNSRNLLAFIKPTRNNNPSAPMMPLSNVELKLIEK